MVHIKVFKTIVLLFIIQTIKAQSYDAFKIDVENYAQSLKLPTLAIGVARGDSLIFFNGIGSASSESQVPITSDHIFTVASVTKSFTSVVLQQLEAEGKISLTDFIDQYPNKYFTKDRWTKNTTLAHIISHTSESNPIGTNFVYNGSKFNLVFNVFSQLNTAIDTESITRPFTKELERRILSPLKMNHTLVRYTEAEHSPLKKFVVTAYDFNDSAGKYLARPINLPKIECGPGYGMMSSVADLIQYSRALDHETIISKQRYKKITSPFYANSVYGEGWFTCSFEGIDIDWAYGYGNNDAAIFLKVPSKNLTLILLSSCSMPSATTRLGYGNPLNSPVVCSFIRNFIFNQPVPIQFDGDLKSIENDIQKNVRQNKSRIYIEEAFATATVSLFSPMTTVSDKERSTELLKLLIKNYPGDAIWQSATAIELMASSNDPFILDFASKVSKDFYRATNLHPAQMFFAGIVQEKSGNKQNAIQLFKMLADGDTYCEQGYKFDALMKLAKYFEKPDPELSKYYLGNLIRYKEYISAQDKQYKEAKEMISKL
ncbi:beta-lactamase family protein [Chitinophagaceae bacterium LB-8]|uniref:Beta-lactamase family protein n=1 Tax=Paraflavisolibacter caeni TaxID=2982496 RepID=A0A9X2Y1C0_9BACT|nr:serine hydrolase [Paraflavisolibacter caeni]MCU7551403.1 beta-lactamase family protein [Paraflavisolibacter caeni]